MRSEIMGRHQNFHELPLSCFGKSSSLFAAGLSVGCGSITGSPKTHRCRAKE
jgi:hypothetical protein